MSILWIYRFFISSCKYVYHVMTTSFIALLNFATRFVHAVFAFSSFVHGVAVKVLIYMHIFLMYISQKICKNMHFRICWNNKNLGRSGSPKLIRILASPGMFMEFPSNFWYVLIFAYVRQNILEQQKSTRKEIPSQMMQFLIHMYTFVQAYV